MPQICDGLTSCCIGELDPKSVRFIRHSAGEVAGCQHCPSLGSGDLVLQRGLPIGKEWVVWSGIPGAFPMPGCDRDDIVKYRLDIL
jgi:hypothetical protein